MDYRDKRITLEDGKEYVVVEQVDFESKIYLYIASMANEDDTAFVEIKDGNVSPIEPELFKNSILPLFMERFSE